MTQKEYIESGAIEAIVMGIADQADLDTHAQMEDMYPEVKAERLRLEADLEAADLGGAIAPPPALKGAVMSHWREQEGWKPAETAPAPPSIAPPEPSKPEAKVIAIGGGPKPVRWLRGALAASVLLLMGSILLNFYYYSLFAGKRREFNAMVLQQNTLLAQNAQMKDEMKMIMSPDIKQVPMPATPNAGNAYCTVYWDNRTKDVYLRVNQLPAAPSGKQYQLWAIVDGKPVDAGLVDLAGNTSMLQRMKNMPNAQAFAITLENKGGSPTPTMEAMMVLGKV